MRKPGWNVTASTYPIDTRFLRLRKDTVALPDGSIVDDYYVRESRGFVVIFALTPQRRVVLVRQYKHGIGRELLELPAGAIDPGEEPLACAQRELAEETGYTAERITLVRSFVTDPTNATTIAHLFVAQNARKTAEQDLDVTESIDVELATLDGVHTMARDGRIDSLVHVAAIYVMLERL